MARCINIECGLNDDSESGCMEKSRHTVDLCTTYKQFKDTGKPQVSSSNSSALVMRKHTLAEVGGHVYYAGLEGKVLGLNHVFDGTPTLDLEDVDNPEKTCTAIEADCITMDNYWHGDCLSESGIQY